MKKRAVGVEDKDWSEIRRMARDGVIGRRELDRGRVGEGWARRVRARV